MTPSQRKHRDLELRVEGERHAGVVIKDNKVLLIHRIKNGQEYYVFPGGHRRKEERGEETVVREILEETNIVVKNPELVFEFKNYIAKNADYYYLCTSTSGEKPKLAGEELDSNPEHDFYDPIWVDTKKIKNLTLYPGFAKAWLVDYLK